MDIAKKRVLRLVAVITCCFWWMNAHAVCSDEKADCGYQPPRDQPNISSGWEICNETKYDRISVSIGYQTSGGKWKSRGSEFINKHECSSMLGRISNRNLYYLVRVGILTLYDNNFDGDAAFCAHSDLQKNYRLKRANKNICESKPGYEWVRFDHVKAKNPMFLRTAVH
ncbi:MAG: DUF1036 domain-containing protein [Pseudomonadota bacterium]|nr:DUF1036 domain-containing protein [Pseudomonadota bacterium]